MSNWRTEADSIDRAVYAAVAAGDTPRLDVAMRGLSRAADYSRLSLTSAAVLALGGGAPGRRAALAGLTSLGATSAAVNLLVKPVARRRRPERPDQPAKTVRPVKMPRSRSFPSGHTACAVAFASGAGRAMPAVSVPLHAVAALVGYSRIHTGVHYPGDVVAGAVIGAVVADAIGAALARRGA